MSIVERAIKKLQDGRAQPQAEPAAKRDIVFGSVVRPEPAASSQTAAPQFQPRKYIEVSRDALRAAELLPPTHQERQIADEYRQIKRPLIANAFGRGAERLAKGHLIMMASALPGEGKTFTSINLALSIALEKDVGVLLVDADVPKPHVSRMFGLQDEPGLIDALTDASISVDDLILGTSIPGLSVLPVGKVSETATELLASKRMEEIVAMLAAQDPNRIILFDSPPLLLTTEARALAHVVGQIVLVVRADETPRSAVLEAIDLVGEGTAISLVLNQSSTQAASGYYGYGQRYGEAPRAQGEIAA